MAQGLTSDRGIGVIDSSERKLVSEQNFLVTVTRLRDGITLIVDSGERLQRAVEHNPGTKTSALEAMGRLDKATDSVPMGAGNTESLVTPRQEAKMDTSSQCIRRWRGADLQAP